jgi:hypothetical protein
MKKKLLSMSTIFLFFIMSFSVSVASPTPDKETPIPEEDNGWYYLPAYPNYSPCGLPDFDQQQDNWKCRQSIWRLIGGLWSFCGPTALADVFWWFDSKHENTTGYPGDGNDTYPLVRDYNAPGTPNPGPRSDDHNFNNVNDPLTSWKNGRGEKELIERLAWYCNTNFCRTPFIRGFAGTYPEYLEQGAKQWIRDAGLEDRYEIEAIQKPDFSMIAQRLRNNDAVILNLLFYNPKAVFFQTFLGHYVAIAGINPNGSVALSDPFQNVMSPDPTPGEHNNPSVVSYDIYPVDFTSPIPEEASWWIKEYFDVKIMKFGGLAHYALIISEKE